MAFQPQQYRDINDKLDQERSLHRGRGAKEFHELIALHSARPGRLPLTVIAYLFNVGSVNTIKSWKIQQEQLENTGGQG